MRATLAVTAGLCVLTALTVYGCASTMSTAPAHLLPPPVITLACPPLKTYSMQEQADLAAALKYLPQDNPLQGAMVDYGKLRAAVRACHG